MPRRKVEPFVFRLKVPAMLSCLVELSPNAAVNVEQALARIREQLDQGDELPWDVYDWQKDYEKLQIEQVSGPAQPQLGLTSPPEPATVSS